MEKTKLPTFARKKGFTLVELLVVIAIIITLSSFAFVGSQKMIKRSQAAAGAQNLRQLYSGIQNVMNEGVNNGQHRIGEFIPYAGVFDVEPPVRFNWMQLVGEQHGYCRLDGNQYVWTTPPSETFFQNPLREEIDTDNISATSGYGYNGMLETWVGPKTETRKVKHTLPFKIKHPSLCIVVAESDSSDGRNQDVFFGRQVPKASEGRKTFTAVFADGHVEEILESEYTVKKYMRVNNNPR